LPPVVQVIELRAFCLLGRCSTAWATAPACFAFFFFFWDRLLLHARDSLHCNSTWVSHIVDMTGMYPSFYWFRWSLANSLPPPPHLLQTLILLLSTFWVARITGLSL
jgi:hypothetical protein